MHPPASSSRTTLWVWGLAAGAFAMAASCLASLTFDGSYYLLHTLQDGAPMVPHRRWLNYLILAPVLWARPLASAPVDLAIWHGLACAAVPLSSLAACLAILRGRFAPLRLWAVLGILIAPLPGQIVLVGEVTPALQASWVGLTFVWAGCPWRWAPVAILATAAAWALHPMAAPMFFLTAATALALGSGAKADKRRRLLFWSVFFALAAAGKGAETGLLATSYERANLHGEAWRAEAIPGLLLTPFAAVLPVLLEAGRNFRSAWRREPLAAGLSRGLWVSAFLLGLGYALHPFGWTGALNYRKFAIVASTPLVVMAGAEAWRLWRSGCVPAREGRSLLLPSLLFVVILGGMSLSWRGLWLSFTEHLETGPGPIQTRDVLSPLERNSALNHWSASSLSLLLQGWSPAKLYVWDAAEQRSETGFAICPGDDFAWSDRALKLSWIGRLTIPAGR